MMANKIYAPGWSQRNIIHLLLGSVCKHCLWFDTCFKILMVTILTSVQVYIITSLWPKVSAAAFWPNACEDSFVIEP